MKTIEGRLQTGMEVHPDAGYVVRAQAYGGQPGGDQEGWPTAAAADAAFQSCGIRGIFWVPLQPACMHSIACEVLSYPHCDVLIFVYLNIDLLQLHGAACACRDGTGLEKNR